VVATMLTAHKAGIPALAARQLPEHARSPAPVTGGARVKSPMTLLAVHDLSPFLGSTLRPVPDGRPLDSHRPGPASAFQVAWFWRGQGSGHQKPIAPCRTTPSRGRLAGPHHRRRRRRHADHVWGSGQLVCGGPPRCWRAGAGNSWRGPGQPVRQDSTDPHV